MSVTKEIVEKENKRVQADRNELHLHREGTFFLYYCLFFFFYGAKEYRSFFDILRFSFSP